ncbi:MAG: response regulator [Candidatus Heimdallarchaeota archaeon]
MTMEIAKNAKKPLNPAIQASAPITRAKVLFVDDEPLILIALKRTFRKDSNLETFIASSAKAALKVLQEQRIDVVVSDFKMPEMDGFDFLKEITHNDPDIVTIFLTGHSDINLVVKTINELSLYAFIQKPWDRDELRSLVRKARNESFQRRQHRTLKRLGETILREQQEAPVLGHCSLDILLVEWDEAFGPKLIQQAYSCINSDLDLEVIGNQIFTAVVHIYGGFGSIEQSFIAIPLLEHNRVAYALFSGIEDEEIRGKVRPFGLIAVCSKVPTTIEGLFQSILIDNAARYRNEKGLDVKLTLAMLQEALNSFNGSNLAISMLLVTDANGTPLYCCRFEKNPLYAGPDSFLAIDFLRALHSAPKFLSARSVVVVEMDDYNFHLAEHSGKVFVFLVRKTVPRERVSGNLTTITDIFEEMVSSNQHGTNLIESDAIKDFEKKLLKCELHTLNPVPSNCISCPVRASCIYSQSSSVQSPSESVSQK